MQMTLIAALEKLSELNDYNDIFVKDNAGEPQTIESAIEDIRNNAEDPDEVEDLYVDAEDIRRMEDGYIVAGEALYKVVQPEEGV